MATPNYNQLPEVIGLIPAAGQATRISPLPGSKELYPIGFQPGKEGSLRPKVVCQYLLERMQLAGIEKAYILLRSGKWDIPAYLGDGTDLGINLGYLMVRLLFGVPYTVDQAYPFVQNAVIALGFPDILFQPEDAFKRLLTRQASTQADVVLGVVPFDQPHKGGMVDVDTAGRVYQVVEKPAQSHLRYSWCVVVWSPVFTEFLHQYLAAIPLDLPQPQEFSIGDVIQAAIENNLRVEAEVFIDGSYLDIGTPDDLVRAVCHLTPQDNDR